MNHAPRSVLASAVLLTSPVALSQQLQHSQKELTEPLKNELLDSFFELSKEALRSKIKSCTEHECVELQDGQMDLARMRIDDCEAGNETACGYKSGFLQLLSRLEAKLHSKAHAWN